jgi:hypothetical protein
MKSPASSVPDVVGLDARNPVGVDGDVEGVAPGEPSPQLPVVVDAVVSDGEEPQR